MGFESLFEVENRNWLFLPVGMILVTYAHLLSAVIFSLFLAIVLVINLKKMTRLVLKRLIISIGITILLVIPIVVNLVSAVKHVSVVSPIVPKPLDQEALILSGLLKNSINNIVPGSLSEVNLGILILFGGVIGLFSIQKYKSMSSNLEIIGIIFLLGSTTIAPWFILQKTPVSIIQFPWRLLGITTFCFSFAAANVIRKVNINKLYYSVSFIILLSTTFNFMHDYLKVSNLKIYANQINQYKKISTDAVYTDYMPNRAFNTFNEADRIAKFRSETHIHKHVAKINGSSVKLKKSQVQPKYNAIRYRLTGLKVNKHYIVELPLLNYGRNFSNDKVTVGSSRQDTTTVKFVANRSVENITVKVR